MEFLLILSWTVTTYLSVLVLMMLVRVIYPLFFSLEESRFFSFVYATHGAVSDARQGRFVAH